jgi:hypothetical protein
MGLTGKPKGVWQRAGALFPRGQDQGDRRLLRDRRGRHLPDVAAVRTVSRHVEPGRVRGEPEKSSGFYGYAYQIPLAKDDRRPGARSISRRLLVVAICQAFASKDQEALINAEIEWLQTQINRLQALFDRAAETKRYADPRRAFNACKCHRLTLCKQSSLITTEEQHQV